MRKNNAKKGLLYGTLGGAALGGIIGAATYKPCAGICIMLPDNRVEAFLYGSLAGALLGGLTGLIIGIFIPAEYGMKAELRPVFYKQDASGLSTVYQGAALRISSELDTNPLELINVHPLFLEWLPHTIVFDLTVFYYVMRGPQKK